MFTVQNPSGKRYTFRVAVTGGTRFTATGHTSTLRRAFLYEREPEAGYIGEVDLNTGGLRLTQASRMRMVSEEDENFRVARWALGLTWAGRQEPEGYVIKHAGRCGRCGRILTVPESIDLGLGPECAGRV